nr:hypothetical protein [Micromonospora inyonensis]
MAAQSGSLLHHRYGAARRRRPLMGATGLVSVRALALFGPEEGPDRST